MVDPNTVRVPRNITAPVLPAEWPFELRRAFEELFTAANGGIEGEDYIFNLVNGTDDESPGGQLLARADENGQLLVADLSNAGILDIINGLTPSANKFMYFTSADAAAVATVTAFARTLLDDANQNTARTTLGVGPADTPAFATVEVGTGGYLVDGTKVIGVQEAAIVSFTDNTTGTGTDTLAVTGDTSTSDQSTPINNNFASLSDKVEEILDVLRSHGLTAT